MRNAPPNVKFAGSVDEQDKATLIAEAGLAAHGT
jgi:hypothetical protein